MSTYMVGNNYVHIGKDGRLYLNGAALAVRVEKRDHIRPTYRPHMCWQAIFDDKDPATCFDTRHDAAEHGRKNADWQSVRDLRQWGDR